MAQYIDLAKKNDAYWYEQIANDGYREIRVKEEIGFSEGANFTQSEWAFFPMYPMLNQWTSNVLNVDFNISALLWSFFFSILTIIGVYWLGAIFFKRQDLAFFNAMLLYGFPFSFYFSTFYTEALFLSLVVFCFIAIHYQRYFILFLLLIPLTLLRPNGIVLLAPLYLFFLEQKGMLSKYKIEWKLLFSKKHILQSLYFISAPVVFCLFCVFQYKMTGFYFAYSIAQDGWYREFMFPVLSFFRRGDLATQFNSFYAIAVIIFAFTIRKKLPISLNFLILISLLLPLCSGSVTSIPRYVSVIFPLFFALTIILFETKRKYVVLLILLVLHFVSFYGWVVGHSISY